MGLKMNIILIFALVALGVGQHGEDPAESQVRLIDMVYVQGGTFEMGDILDGDLPLASPVHTVTAMSWWDAVNYCNWLSTRDGLPIAYDLASGQLLDGEGRPTTDVTKVKGYRLPPEEVRGWAMRALHECPHGSDGWQKTAATTSDFALPGRDDIRHRANHRFIQQASEIPQ